MFDFFKRPVTIKDVPNVHNIDIGTKEDNTVSELRLSNKEKIKNTVHFKMWHSIFFKGNIKLVGSDTISEYVGAMYIAVYVGQYYAIIIATDEYGRTIDFSGPHLFTLLSKSPTLTDEEKVFVNNSLKNLNGSWFVGKPSGIVNYITMDSKAIYRIGRKKPARDANGKFTKKKD